MTMPAALSTVLLPTLGGLIVGFGAGVLTGIFSTLRWVTRRSALGDSVPIYTDETNPTPGHRPLRSKEHFSKLGWVFVVLGLLGIVLGSISLYQNNRTAGCVARFTQANAVTTQERSEAGALDRQAIRQQRAVTRELNQEFIDAIANPVTDPAAQTARRDQFLVKARDWNARLEEVDRLDRTAEEQRQQNPLPAPPSC